MTRNYTLSIAVLGLCIASPAVGEDAMNVYYSIAGPTSFAVVPLAADYAVEDRSSKWVEFQNLAKQWRIERGVRSSITESAMLPSYQNIIGMGPDVIEPIILELKSTADDPDQWFWALGAITKANPVDPADQGDFVKMAQAWIKWAEEKGYAG